LTLASAQKQNSTMSSESDAPWRIVPFAETEVERLPGKTHFWHCKPGMVAETNLMFVRAQLPPGEAHRFHHHPKMEEILYILSGTAEQWVEGEKRMMRPGDSIYIPVGMVHATYNACDDTLDFLAVLSPAGSEGPPTVEVADQEPWRSLRK
jgi:quercetin dioxygenase-like cupin family protein